MKPILFNTEMVRAILDGRKTVTRRVVKRSKQTPACYGRENFSGLRNELNGDKSHLWAGFYKESDIFFVDGKKRIDSIYFKSPYQPSDILYVRETWAEVGGFSPRIGEFWQQYIYRATYKPNYELDVPAVNWHPSIHMPKESARIFLRVTDVRVERLQDIDDDGVVKEGVGFRGAESDLSSFIYRSFFKDEWDKTIKPKGKSTYGWDANPYVWVIEFERISKETALA